MQSVFIIPRGVTYNLRSSKSNGVANPWHPLPLCWTKQKWVNNQRF